MEAGASLTLTVPAHLSANDFHRTVLALAPRAEVSTHVSVYPLSRANEALDDLRHGRFDGAGVLVPDELLAA